MVLYEYDDNAILAEPIKNRTSPELLRAFQVMETKLTARGIQPKLTRLDNEASQLLNSYLHDKNITFQLVPPYSHRINAAERAIISFKDHLIAGICSTYKEFPMHLWDRLLPQEVITLNMLGISQINPNVSASTHIDGQYDYNRAPMASPGTRIIAHETLNRRRTWAPHGQDGWYIGPALEHYRCYTVYITKKRSERVVETVDFFPTEVPLPFPSSKELATQAAKQLIHALLNPQPVGPFCQVGDEQMLALQQLTAIYEGALPARKKDTTSPLFEINDIDAPPRVQIAVSPPRVVNGTTPSRAVHPTVITSTTPNSHRRLSTTPARAVTPNTPHAMIRRSAHQQNLTDDMLAETIQQENHVFFTPNRVNNQVTNTEGDGYTNHHLS
jgi:hypothetical protein